MIRLSKLLYWEKMVDYYYDNVRWAINNPPSISAWARQEFNARASICSTELIFDNPADAAWFMLRWA